MRTAIRSRACRPFGRAKTRVQSGAVLVETSIVAMIIAMMALGAIEYGLLLRQASVVADTVRSGVRAASFVSNSEAADYEILMAMKDSDAGLAGDIKDVVIYKANANGLPSDPQCANFEAKQNHCTVYSGDDFSMSKAEIIATSASRPGWKPADRSPTVDYLGIKARAQQGFITKMFGDSHTVSDVAVIRLEPAPPASQSAPDFSSGSNAPGPEGVSAPCFNCGGPTGDGGVIGNNNG